MASLSFAGSSGGVTTVSRSIRPLVAAVAAALLAAAFLVALQPAPSHAASGKSIIGWGRNTWGEADVPLGMGDVRQVSATAHTVVLHEDGTVQSWGHNRYGECDVPADLPAVEKIAAGGFHTMALTTDGALRIWGQDQYGQSSVPAGLGEVAEISGGRFHSLALRTDGTVVAWGLDDRGQSTVPAGLDDVVAIDGGGWHSLALRSDGTVVAWGDDTYGQSTVPAGLDDVVAVAAGWNHSLALRSDGTVVAWGDDTYGQSTVPAALGPVASITAGATHSLVALRDGTVASWGDTAYGLMDVPRGITGTVQVSAKAMHSMVLADDPAPTPVVGIYASIVTNAKVTLNWSYPAEATDHDVARIIVRGAPGEVPPATVDDGVGVPLGRPMQQYATDATGSLTVGERYSYSVFTQDKAGNVGVPATITVPVAFPGPVTDAAATADSATSLALTWRNPANDQLKRIIVRRAVGPTPPATASSGTNVSLPTALAEGVTSTGLGIDTTYSYSVFAQDRIGNVSPLGPGSTVTASTGSGTGTPPTGTAPGVTNLTAPIVTNAKVSLSWTYPSGTARVIVRGAPGAVAPATATDGVEVPLGRPVTTSATDPTGLAVGERYSYSVFAQDAEGRTSAPTSITVPVAFPGPVTGVTVTAVTSTSLALSWTNPDNDQLKRIIVRRATGTTPPATHTAGTNVPLDVAVPTSVTSTGLAPGTTYSYAVFAQDRIGNISLLGATSTVTGTTGPPG